MLRAVGAHGVLRPRSADARGPSPGSLVAVSAAVARPHAQGLERSPDTTASFVRGAQSSGVEVLNEQELHACSTTGAAGLPVTRVAGRVL
jgi:hypothetical protein